MIGVASPFRLDRLHVNTDPQFLVSRFGECDCETPNPRAKYLAFRRVLLLEHKTSDEVLGYYYLRFIAHISAIHLPLRFFAWGSQFVASFAQIGDYLLLGEEVDQALRRFSRTRARMITEPGFPRQILEIRK